MHFDWLTWSNPVAIWWGFLLVVSAVNIVFWLLLHRHSRNTLDRQRGMFRVDLMVLLCAAYVFGCAFRSILPRADVQRICLFDTWLSSVVVGRSVATAAEICFALQWAIVLHQLGRLAKSDTAQNISILIVPLILVAECCSWYSVITTSYLGNTDRKFHMGRDVPAHCDRALAAVERVPRPRSSCDRNSGCRCCWLSGVPRLRRRADVFRPVASGSDKRKRAAWHLRGLA